VIDRIVRALLPERALGDEDRRAVQAELEAYNRRAAQILAPVVVVVHAASALTYGRVQPSGPAEAEWLHGLQWMHGAMVPFSVLLWCWTVWERAPGRRYLGELVAAVYVLFGAVLSANAQRTHTALNAYLGAVLASGVLLRARPAVFVPIVVAGCATVATAAARLQPLRSVAMANVFNAATFSIVSLVTFFLTHVSKVRELAARRALERVNGELERRVDAQVREIVARAREVDQLNVQLDARVRERSAELARALEQLAAVGRGAALPKGTVLGGRVELVERLGVGGMGIVYRGFDRLTQAEVAVKVVQAGSERERAGLLRFLQEAQATASVRHPAIRRTLHIDVSDDGGLYQILELVEGEGLDERLGREPRMAWTHAARMGAVLAEALAAAHAAGIVHRDVKPPNVMLTPAAPGLKLLDFGVSKLRDALAPASGATGQRLLGTPEFMAPEQIADASAVGERADVYALGVVLYVCVSGSGPYHARTPTQWLHAHAVLAPLELAARGVCPPELAELVMRCLRKSPEERPPAAAVARELARLADEAGAPSLVALERARPAELADGTLDVAAPGASPAAPSRGGRSG
jgi:serine/threonine-protein kinase